jgi:hypothetical protein
MTLEEAVRRAAPVDEATPVELPSGRVVPFATVIAMTNGEALDWVVPASSLPPEKEQP